MKTNLLHDLLVPCLMLASFSAAQTTPPSAGTLLQHVWTTSKPPEDWNSTEIAWLHFEIAAKADQHRGQVEDRLLEFLRDIKPELTRQARQRSEFAAWSLKQDLSDPKIDVLGMASRLLTGHFAWKQEQSVLEVALPVYRAACAGWPGQDKSVTLSFKDVLNSQEDSQSLGRDNAGAFTPPQQAQLGNLAFDFAIKAAIQPDGRIKGKISGTMALSHATGFSKEAIRSNLGYRARDTCVLANLEGTACTLSPAHGATTAPAVTGSAEPPPDKERGAETTSPAMAGNSPAAGPASGAAPTAAVTKAQILQVLPGTWETGSSAKAKTIRHVFDEQGRRVFHGEPGGDQQEAEIARIEEDGSTGLSSPRTGTLIRFYPVSSVVQNPEQWLVLSATQNRIEFMVLSEGAAPHPVQIINKVGGAAAALDTGTTYQWQGEDARLPAWAEGIVVKSILVGGKLKPSIEKAPRGKGTVPFVGDRKPIDNPGSKDIHIAIDKKAGRTLYAGLTFTTPCVVEIRSDGTLLADKEGVVARDGEGKEWISKRLLLKGMPAVAFTPTGRAAAVAADAAPAAAARREMSDEPYRMSHSDPRAPRQEKPGSGFQSGSLLDEKGDLRVTNEQQQAITKVISSIDTRSAKDRARLVREYLRVYGPELAAKIGFALFTESSVYVWPPPADAEPQGGAAAGVAIAKEPPDAPANWPAMTGELRGGIEVRVHNPNEFSVKVGLRSGGKGRDFSVAANGVKSAYVPNGSYDIYFQYSTDPDGLYQGDRFTLRNNGVEIKIVKVVNGNYGIRKVR